MKLSIKGKAALAAVGLALVMWFVVVPLMLERAGINQCREDNGHWDVTEKRCYLSR